MSPRVVPCEAELVIDELDAMASGVGSLDGMRVRVPFALPGEKVRVRIWRIEAAKAQAQADLLEVLVPHPQRIAPRCSVFGQCGGCQLQSWSYLEQLNWKTKVVRDWFTPVDLGERVSPAIGSPREFGYRSKITPHYELIRPGQPFAVGFLRIGRRHDIVDAPQCPLATDGINAALPALRAAAAVAVVGRKRGASLLLREGALGVTDDPDALIRERVGEIELEFYAREFFQNNPFLLPRLVDFVIDQAASFGVPILVDTYSGSGLFALSGARRFERVLGVEVSAVAAAAAKRNAANNAIENVEFQAAPAAKLFQGIAISGDDAVVIVDPPRKGSDEVFLSQLVAFRPRGVIYVSCNPETAVRDLARLTTSGFRVRTIQPFDMFPQTRHIECVAVLERSESDAAADSPRG